MDKTTSSRRTRRINDPDILVKKKNSTEEIIGESPKPLPVVSKAPIVTSIDNNKPARKRVEISSKPVTRKPRGIETDPGELVSAWHQMNKKYQNALDSLSKVADQLDELSRELETKFGIKVPNAKRLNTNSNSQMINIPVQQSYDDYETEPYQEGGWSPPPQSAVSTTTVNNPNFIEKMRRDSSVDSANSDQAFAASIAAQFQNIMGSLG